MSLKIEITKIVLGTDGPEALLVKYGGDLYTFSDSGLVEVEDVKSLITIDVDDVIVKDILGEYSLEDLNDVIVDSYEEDVALSNVDNVEKIPSFTGTDVAAEGNDIDKLFKTLETFNPEDIIIVNVDDVKEEEVVEDFTLPTMADFYRG